jgi:hypothetical protein
VSCCTTMLWADLNTGPWFYSNYSYLFPLKERKGRRNMKLSVKLCFYVIKLSTQLFGVWYLIKIHHIFIPTLFVFMFA